MSESRQNSTPKRSVFNNVMYLLSCAWKWNKEVYGYLGLFTIFWSIAPFIPIFIPKFLIDELTGGQRYSKTYPNHGWILHSIFFSEFFCSISSSNEGY